MTRPLCAECPNPAMIGHDLCCECRDVKIRAVTLRQSGYRTCRLCGQPGLPMGHDLCEYHKGMVEGGHVPKGYDSPEQRAEADRRRRRQ